MSTCEVLETTVPSDSVKQYKLWLLEAREMRKDLRQQIGRRIYRMMKLLLQAFDDPEFRADNGSADDFQAGVVLDDFVLDDTGLEFLQLRAMMKRYPKEPAWRDGRLHRMYRDMVAADNAAGKLQKPKRERSPALTKAEYAAVSRAAERQRVMLTAANEQLQAATSECTQKQTEVERLRERVHVLEADNARLRAKVIAMGGNPDE